MLASCNNEKLDRILYYILTKLPGIELQSKDLIENKRNSISPSVVPHSKDFSLLVCVCVPVQARNIFVCKDLIRVGCFFVRGLATQPRPHMAG